MDKLVLEDFAVDAEVTMQTNSRGVKLPRIVLKIISRHRFPKVDILAIDGLSVKGPPVTIVGSTPTPDVADVHLGTLVVGERIVMTQAVRQLRAEPLPCEMSLLSSATIAQFLG